MNELVIFCGTGAERLGRRIARLLDRTVGACNVGRFPDGEVNVCLEEPIRGRPVYIVQSTCSPVDENLVELLAIVDACRRASASGICAVMPYFGYARGDKRNGRRAPVTGRMVATLMEAVGVGHLLTVDLHAAQMEGFFQIPVDSVSAVPALCHALKSRLADGTVVVSPDEGRLKMATDFARQLHLPVAVLHKERRSDTSTRTTHLIGDVRERPCLIIDDMISTGGTISEAISALLQAGARPDIVVAATHGVFSGNARERLTGKSIREIIVTDSIPQRYDWPELKIVSLAPLLAAAIRRFQAGESLGDLFERVIHGGIEDAPRVGHLQDS